MALLRADMLTNIQYIILIILINMINQQALFIVIPCSSLWRDS